MTNKTNYTTKQISIQLNLSEKMYCVNTVTDFISKTQFIYAVTLTIILNKKKFQKTFMADLDTIFSKINVQLIKIYRNINIQNNIYYIHMTNKKVKKCCISLLSCTFKLYLL